MADSIIEQTRGELIQQLASSQQAGGVVQLTGTWACCIGRPLLAKGEARKDKGTKSEATE